MYMLEERLGEDKTIDLVAQLLLLFVVDDDDVEEVDVDVEVVAVLSAGCMGMKTEFILIRSFSLFEPALWIIFELFPFKIGLVILLF
jgi:hypothetical protein